MNPIKKNILVNAAKSCGQNREKTLELTSRYLTSFELKSVESFMKAGNTITHENVNCIL